MKRRLKDIWMVVGACFLLTCSQEADRTVFTGPDFVFFDTKPHLTLYENQTTALVIPVKVSQAQSENTSVVFEVVGSNVLPVSDYIVQTASPVTIQRSKFGSSISILPVDNAIIQPEIRTITIRIKSIDNPKLSPQVVKEVVINLLDDDCPSTVPKVSLWVGTVSIGGGASTSSSGTAEAGAGGICGGTLVVTGNFFGTGFPASTMTIIMTQNVSLPTKGFTSVVRFPLLVGSQYEYEASGSYDETPKNITLNFTVYDTTDPTFNLTGTHTITHQ